VIADAIPQRDALRMQLAMIAGNSPSSSFLEFRLLPDRQQFFFGVRDLDDAVGGVEVLRDRGNLYVGAAPRSRRSGTASVVPDVHCLWADCDTEESVARLQGFEPPPSIIVRSGSNGNLHAWWQLSPPIPGAWAEVANARLAHYLGADTAATDRARVMRPVGSLNFKSSPPRSVECISLELPAYTAAKVVGGLPNPPQAEPRRAPSPPAIGGKLANISSDVTLAGLARYVQDAIPHDETGRGRNSSLNWSAFTAGQHVTAGRLSEEQVERELLAAALEVGLDEDEALRTIRSGLRGGRGQKP